MSQSNAIFAYLFIAFVIFITMRGKLRRYIGFLLGDVSVPIPKPAASSGGNSEASNAVDTVTGLAKAVALFGV